MGEIDLDYCEALFMAAEHHGVITYPYYGYGDNDNNLVSEFVVASPAFLEMVISYADSKDIPEVHKTDRNGLDDRFCYWIRFKNKVIEIGMYYDDTVYILDPPDDVTPEYVMDCEDIIVFDMKSKNILFEDFKPIEITEATRRDVLEHPERYANCPPRIRMGNFYTDEEWKRYAEESLNKPLPGDIKSAKKIRLNFGKKGDNHNK